MAAFSNFCGQGELAAAGILEKADAAGWAHAGPMLPAGFQPATDRFKTTSQGFLTLRVTHNASAGELRNGCGVISNFPQPNLIIDTARILGIDPQVNLGTSANFFVVRASKGWLSASALSPTALKTAKDRGLYFSIMALGSDHDATLVALHVIPDSALLPTR